jgi:hypothetical protein
LLGSCGAARRWWTTAKQTGGGGSSVGRTGRTASMCCGMAIVRSFIARTRRRYTQHQCPGRAMDVGLRAQGRKRRTPEQNAAVVRCGTKMQHASLEGRRGGEPAALTSRRWERARTVAEAGAAPCAWRGQTGGAPGTPAALWSAAEQHFSRLT